MLQKIGAIMSGIENLDQQTLSSKQAWQKLNRQAGPKLQEAIQEVKSAIEQLMRPISDAESKARSAKERLVPQLNGEYLGRQMQAAYSSAQYSE